ncbi:MAG: AAA family ATPase, partial [Actinobacteria bacterium]|nr:AAA family ATPase [Actinomycetota bacterium]
PGIGKTRLTSEFRAVFEEGSALRGRPRWLEGKCVSYGEPMTYWPFRDLVRSWLGVLADEPEMRVRVALRRNVERLFGDRAPELYPYLAAMLGLSLEPDAQERLSELSPEALQYRTFEVVRELLRRLAEDGPVAVALEDLHWADATSLQLLERLLPDTETSALLLILTLRQERDHPAWRLKENAARELPHRTTEVALEALSGDAGLDLLRSLVGSGTLPEDMERRILEHAEGNPFFLEELVRSLADAGSLEREGDTWRFDHEAEVEIPPTVEKVILARIDRLESQPHAVLMAASVLGREFGLPLLEAVSGDGDVRPSLSSLMRLDLLREARRWPEPEYRFKHALIQEAAYRTLVVDERRAPSMRKPRRGSRTATPAARRRSPGCSHTTGSPPRTKTRRSPTLPRPATAPGRSTRSTRPSRAIASCCLSSSAAGSRTRSPSCCSSSPSRSTCRCGSPRRTRPTSVRSVTGAGRVLRPRHPRPCCGSGRASSRTIRIRARRSRGRTSSSACSYSIDWSKPGRSGRSCPPSPSGGRSPTTACATCSTSAKASCGRTGNSSRPAMSSSGSSVC